MKSHVLLDKEMQGKLRQSYEDMSFSGARNLFCMFYEKERVKLGKVEYKKHKMPNRSTPMGVVTEIFKRIQYHMVEHRSGVHMKGFGYFFINRSPESFFHGKYRLSRSVVHEPIYVPTSADVDFWGWSMDDHFTKYITKDVRKKIRKGQHYINMFYTVSKNKFPLSMGWEYISSKQKKAEYMVHYVEGVRGAQRSRVLNGNATRVSKEKLKMYSLDADCS